MPRPTHQHVHCPSGSCRAGHAREAGKHLPDARHSCAAFHIRSPSCRGESCVGFSLSQRPQGSTCTSGSQQEFGPRPSLCGWMTEAGWTQSWELPQIHKPQTLPRHVGEPREPPLTRWLSPPGTELSQQAILKSLPKPSVQHGTGPRILKCPCHLWAPPCPHRATPTPPLHIPQVLAHFLSSACPSLSS